MLILRSRAERSDGGSEVLREALLFGVGLIGARIAARLEGRGWTAETLALSWDDDTLRRRQLTALQRRLASSSPARRHWIWTAGRAGFGSTTEETDGERRSFRDVLAAAEEDRRRSGVPTLFHMASSVGGLFEGQRHVTRHSRPRPLRPYGELKLWQEERLADPAVFGGARRVYRLSSVYGPAPGNERRGLVATLLYDAMAGRTTTLVGRLSTLRDYLWSEDLAGFVVASLSGISETWRRPSDRRGSEESGRRIFHLASGKPSSIHEILEIVARVVGRRPSLRFARAHTNSTDITLAPSSLPPRFVPTDLETSVRSLHRTLGGQSRSGRSRGGRSRGGRRRHRT